MISALQDAETRPAREETGTVEQNDHIRQVIAAYDARFWTHYADFVAQDRDYTARSTFPVHVTASLFGFSADLSAVLLIHHKIIGRWFQPGGHLEPGESLTGAAFRETREETGLMAELKPDATPISIDLHRIAENPKRQEPEHYHLDIRFAARLSGTLTPDLAEVKAAEWFPVTAVDTVDERIRPRLPLFFG
nr:NUDIX hydrolase [Martelella sp. HB161492]